MKSKIDNLKKTEKERMNNMKRLDKAIEEAEKQLANPPETEDYEGIQNEIVRLPLP